jgi:hypothetical protein
MFLIVMGKLLERQPAYNLLLLFLKIIQPGTTAKLLKEDSESAAFWNPLGGKKTHPNYRDSKEAGKDPRLFACPLVKGMSMINKHSQNIDLCGRI